MSRFKTNQSGHVHLPLVAAVVVVIGAIGFYVYNANFKPSRVSDPAVRAELKKASSDLKSVNLASVKVSVDSISSTQSNYKE